MLGKVGAAKDFTIHTKAPALAPGAMTKQSVLDGMEQSLKKLGVDSVSLPPSPNNSRTPTLTNTPNIGRGLLPPCPIPF